jgi:uncharacterized protein (TIGR02996 family)
MSEDAALLRAIIEEPDEDAHRLVYADWLDEHGQPDRAEFIRLHCRLERFYDGDPFTAGFAAEHLKPEQRRAWLGPLATLGIYDGADGSPVFQYRMRGALLFRRGFVEAVQLFRTEGLRQFLERAGAVFDRTPLRHLRLHAGGGYYPAPSRSAVRLLRQLVALPQVRRLRTLDLRGHGLGDKNARLLAASPNLSRELRLVLEGNRITAEGREVLEQRFGRHVSCGADWDPFEDDIPF